MGARYLGDMHKLYCSDTKLKFKKNVFERIQLLHRLCNLESLFAVNNDKSFNGDDDDNVARSEWVCRTMSAINLDSSSRRLTHWLRHTQLIPRLNSEMSRQCITRDKDRHARARGSERLNWKLISIEAQLLPAVKSWENNDKTTLIVCLMQRECRQTLAQSSQPFEQSPIDLLIKIAY